MKRTVEFQETKNAPDITAKREQKQFRDETYIQSHRGIQLKFEKFMTWFRVVPGIKGSEFGWIRPFKRFNDTEGRFPTFVCPTTFGQQSVFSQAQQWLRKNDPSVLYSKTNPNGLRLYPQERCLVWVIDTEAEENRRLRLFNSSMYNGERGGTPGLGYQMYSMATSIDAEPGSETQGKPIYGDVSSPEEGRLIGVSKSVPVTGDTKFASYSVKIGKNVSKLNMSMLTDEEFALLIPLDKVLKCPTVEEQKEYLKCYIGEDLFSKIFQ